VCLVRDCSAAVTGCHNRMALWRKWIKMLVVSFTYFGISFSFVSRAALVLEYVFLFSLAYFHYELLNGIIKLNHVLNQSLIANFVCAWGLNHRQCNSFLCEWKVRIKIFHLTERFAGYLVIRCWRAFMIWQMK
jgi:hypothetical protein